MADDNGPNADQATYWNDSAGPVWVEMQDTLDRELRPLGVAAMAALGPATGERIIDIGCGCGETSLDLARRVGPSGSVLGADLSAPMLGVARERARAAGLAQAAFVQADAQVYAFEPADAVFSRFGVMFFDDPPAAFANLRKALKPGGRIAFVCWRAAADNAVMTLPAVAARPFLPEPSGPPPDPHAPGPFAFADRARLEGILGSAGFTDVKIAPHDEDLWVGGVEETTQLSLRIGPLGAALRENPHLRDTVIGAVGEALSKHLTPEGVRLASATWIVTARNG